MSSLLLKVADGEGQLIRGIIHGGIQYFSVYDFMTKACKYTNSGASARNEFKRLTNDGSEYKDELVALCYTLKFPGRGQQENAGSCTVPRRRRFNDVQPAQPTGKGPGIRDSP
jgi:hypothetical protein